MFASLALNTFTAGSVDALTKCMNDIEAILTNNTTQVNNLTFFVAGAPSEISRNAVSCGYDSATGLGWQVYENTNYYTRVFRAKNSEAPSNYLYLRITLTNTSTYGLDINMVIGDLLSTGTNTNQCDPKAINTNAYTVIPDNATSASNSRLFIHASKEHVFFHSRNVEDSILGTPSYYVPMVAGILPFPRSGKAKTGNYPLNFISNNNGNLFYGGQITKLWNTSNTDVTVQAYTSMASASGLNPNISTSTNISITATSPSAKVYSDSGVTEHVLFPYVIAISNIGLVFGNETYDSVSKKFGLYEGHTYSQSTNWYESVVRDGQEYIALRYADSTAASYYRIVWVKKG